MSQSWRRNWAGLIPCFDYSAEIRKVIYTTNAVESVNMSLRKLTKNRGSFLCDEALLKLFYLALRNIQSEVDHADSGLEGSVDSLYHSIRGADSTAVTQTPFTQKFGQAQESSRKDQRISQLCKSRLTS